MTVDCGDDVPRLAAIMGMSRGFEPITELFFVVF
jgi:hypothetical protein